MGDIHPFDRKPRSPPRARSSGAAKAIRYIGALGLAVVAAVAIHLSDFWQQTIAPELPRIVRNDGASGVTVENRSTRQASGQTYNAIDGDSLRTSREDIRLLGIDAPELFQTCRDARGRQWACGREAHTKLKALVSRGDVRCTSTGRDRFNRVLAICSAGPVADVGEIMVRDGLAVDFMNGRYAGAEAEARRSRRGIWAGQFEQPQEWRRRNPRGDQG
jgi:endonuclease YncB( thermonuclease family)